MSDLWIKEKERIHKDIEFYKKNGFLDYLKILNRIYSDFINIKKSLDFGFYPVYTHASIECYKYGDEIKIGTLYFKFFYDDDLLLQFCKKNKNGCEILDFVIIKNRNINDIVDGFVKKAIDLYM